MESFKAWSVLIRSNTEGQSSGGGPGFNPQSRTASYQRRYTNGTRKCPCLALNIKKGNTGSFSRIKKGQNVMYTIWDRSPSKSEAVVTVMKKLNDHNAELTKVELQKIDIL